MASGSKKTIPLSDKKNLSKVKSKPESGLRISADPGLNFNYLDFSGMDSLVNKPIMKELAEKMAGDPEFDQIAEQLRRSIPTAWMKEMFPDFDPERCINIMRQDLGNPELRKTRENLFNHFLRDPPMSPGSRS